MVKQLSSDQVFHLNNTQRHTWNKIMTTPTVADLKRREVCNLFVSLGADIKTPAWLYATNIGFVSLGRGNVQKISTNKLVFSLISNTYPISI